MESILTASCKVPNSLEQVARIKATIKGFAGVCNRIDRSVNICFCLEKDQTVNLTFIGEKKIFKLLLGSYQILMFELVFLFAKFTIFKIFHAN